MLAPEGTAKESRHETEDLGATRRRRTHRDRRSAAAGARDWRGDRTAELARIARTLCRGADLPSGGATAERGGPHGLLGSAHGTGDRRQGDVAGLPPGAGQLRRGIAVPAP